MQLTGVGTSSRLSLPGASQLAEDAFRPCVHLKWLVEGVAGLQLGDMQQGPLMHHCFSWLELAGCHQDISKGGMALNLDRCHLAPRCT